MALAAHQQKYDPSNNEERKDAHDDAYDGTR